MTQKTKAEKIASALRAKRTLIPSTSSVSVVVDLPKARVAYHDSDVYHAQDLRKTIGITLFVVALLTLVYVFQYKGYF